MRGWLARWRLRRIAAQCDRVALTIGARPGIDCPRMSDVVERMLTEPGEAP